MLAAKATPQQIDAWRAAKFEDEHLEFKEAKSQFDFDKLLKYCVALANERGGKLLLGIEDKPPRLVVGTNAFRNPQKTAEDIFNKLGFRVDVEEVQHPDGRVVVLHIPSRPLGHPYELDGSYWMRSGESLVSMTPEQLKQIFAEDKSNKNQNVRTRRKKLVYAVIAFLLASVILVQWKTKRPTGPKNPDITWNFDIDQGRFGFLAMGAVPGVVDEPLVYYFQAHGRNNLDDPIIHFSGLIRSDATNEIFPIFLARDNKLLRPEDTLGIPRKSEFDLTAKPFPSNHPDGYGSGINATMFLRQYPELTFVFEYDGKKYVKHFSRDEIWDEVERFRRQSLGYDKP